MMLHGKYTSLQLIEFLFKNKFSTNGFKEVVVNSCGNTTWSSCWTVWLQGTLGGSQANKTHYLDLWECWVNYVNSVPALFVVLVITRKNWIIMSLKLWKPWEYLWWPSVKMKIQVAVSLSWVLIVILVFWSTVSKFSQWVQLTDIKRASL